MDSVIVQSPSGPAVFVEILAQLIGRFRLLAAWTTYCAPGVPPKRTVTVPSPLFTRPRVRGRSLSGETACVRPFELPVKFESPGYAAVIRIEPGGKTDVLKTAMPETNATGEPKATPFVRNCTLPVGVVNAGATGVNVAVKITFDP